MAVSQKISTTSTSVNNASQISSRIATLKKFTSENKSKVDDVVAKLEDPLSSIGDPIGSTLKRILFKINSLIQNIETKIDKLAKDAVKSVDNKGRVELIESTIVITVTPQDVARAQAIQSNITRNITSINNSLRILSSTLNTLNSVAQTIRAIQIALNIQELILTINPVSKATFTVFKQAIKLVFLKDAMKEYSKILTTELRSSKASLDRLINKFRNLNIKIVVSDEANKGNKLSDAEAESMISDSLLSSTPDTKNLYEEYRSINEKEYILVVEKYDDTQLIGRAKEKFSGMLAAQTAPSFFSTGDQLLTELKNILDTSN